MRNRHIRFEKGHHGKLEIIYHALSGKAANLASRNNRMGLSPSHLIHIETVDKSGAVHFKEMSLSTAGIIDSFFRYTIP